MTIIVINIITGVLEHIYNFILLVNVVHLKLIHFVSNKEKN